MDKSNHMEETEPKKKKKRQRHKQKKQTWWQKLGEMTILDALKALGL